MIGPHRLGASASFSCAYLVIGSGAGGATIARRLAEAGQDVVILEEGPLVTADQAPTDIPKGVSKLWRCGGLTAGMGKSPVAYAEGRCVGGGTEINSGIMQRAPGELLEEWSRDYQIEAFSEEALRPFYDRVAKSVNTSLGHQPFGEPSDLLKNGAETMGWQVKALERAVKTCVGTNLCATACPTGGKQSMTATALPKALAAGARLITDCRVDKLVLKNGTVVQVKATATDFDGGKHDVTLRPKVVIVAAGAIHTPALLRRSGLKHNIGNNLRMHPTIKALARFDHEINAQDSALPQYAVTQFMPDQRLGGSLFQPGFLGMSLAEDPTNRNWLLPDWKKCGVYYAMARGEAKGYVRPVPGWREPIVFYNPTPTDWRNLAQGMSRLAQALFASGATHIYPSVTGHKGWTSAQEAEQAFSQSLPQERTNLMTIHLFSSCPMGEDRTKTATNSYGRVHDVANLYIGDASVIPEAPGVNPQLTIMALALRTAESLLELSK